MPAKRRPPISVLDVLTIDGWDERQKEFRNLYQTDQIQTIGDISWMSFRRNRQAGHWMTISRENVWGMDLHEELFCQCHKRWRFHQELLFKIQCRWWEACYYTILIALKILISEKTLEQEKLRNERGKRRNGHTRTSLCRTSLYRIGLVGLPLFKGDEIHLRWGFTVKTTVILLKNVFEIIGLDQL